MASDLLDSVSLHGELKRPAGARVLDFDQVAESDFDSGGLSIIACSQLTRGIERSSSITFTVLQQLALTCIVLFAVIALVVGLEQGSGMSRATPQTLLMALGVVLLFIGGTIVVMQLYLQAKEGYPAISDLKSGDWRKMRYLGSAIAGVGAVLEVIALMATRP